LRAIATERKVFKGQQINAWMLPKTAPANEGERESTRRTEAHQRQVGAPKRAA